MHIADLKVPQTWTKLVDLIDLGREKFEIEENKDYYLHNKSNYILYAAESEGVPTEETPEIRIYGGQSAGYIKATGDLYVCSKLPDLYPYPATISVIFSDDVAATNAIAIGNYKPETDVRGAYVYRGSVADRNALPKEGMEIGDVYNLEDTGMNVAWTGTIWDSLGSTVSVDLTPYAKKAEVTEALATKAEAADVTALEAKVDEVKAVADKAVLYSDFEYQGQQRKTIQLANYDSISGIGTDGVGYNLAMVSKWDKADFGAAGITMNLNTKDVVTINDDLTVATTKDIEDAIATIDHSTYATKEELNAKADKTELESYALKTEVVTPDTLAVYATKDEMDIAVNAKANTTDVEALEAKVEEVKAVADNAVPYFLYDNRKFIQMANHDSLSGVMTNGDAGNLIMMSKWDKVDIGTSKVVCNLNAKDGVVTINDDKQIATQQDVTDAVAAIDLTPYATKVELAGKANTSDIPTNVSAFTNDAGYLTEHQDISNLATKEEVEDVKDLTPVMVQIPIRTNSTFNTIQDKETILGWFGCTQDSELKGLISRQQPMFLKYGISLSTNPHYYKMPIQYIAYESATQIKIVTIGLDTNNDVVSKYEILMNLDGTVIENGSNVKMTITELEGNYATKEELANKADTSALAAKADTSALEALQQQLAELTSRVEALESPAA